MNVVVVLHRTIYNCRKHTSAGSSHHWEAQALDKMDALLNRYRWYPFHNWCLHLLCNMAKEKETGNEAIAASFSQLRAEDHK
jgi:hypothetical protein